MHQPSIIAHRGASGRYPENTIRAFVEAVALGADGVEMDVRLSADHVPIVIHDPGLLDDEETVHAVAALKAKEITQFGGPKENEENIPTLSQALGRIPLSQTCFIELKEGVQLAHKVMPVVDTMRVDATNTWFLSFSLSTLSEIKAYRRHWNCMLLVPPPQETEGRKLGYYVTMAHHAGIEALGLSSEWEDREQEVQGVAAAGLELSVWTVNEESSFDFWVKQGAKYITTDFPERFAIEKEIVDEEK